VRSEEYFRNLFSARTLFIAGLVIMPALLFNPVTELRVIQFLFFWFLAILCGKKTNPVFTVLVTVFIIAFNLIIPYGKVLYSAGVFQITSGALQAGIHRAVTLQALIMLSKVTVRQDLKLPGAFGELLGESLRMFSMITDKKLLITGKNIIKEIDSLMLELSEEPLAQQTDIQIKTKPAGYILITIVIILSWLPWLNIIFNF